MAQKSLMRASVVLAFFLLGVLLKPSAISAQSGWCWKWDFTLSNTWNITQGSWDNDGYFGTYGDFYGSINLTIPGGILYETASVEIRNDWGSANRVRLYTLLWADVQDNTVIMPPDSIVSYSIARSGGVTQTAYISVDADVSYADIRSVTLRGSTLAAPPQPPGAINCASLTPTPIVTIAPPIDGYIPFLPSPTAIASYTPQPTPSAPSSSVIYQFLATAAAQANAFPDDITSPGGVNQLVNTDTQTLFGYARWMFSDVGARELLGPNFGLIAIGVFSVMVSVFIFMPMRIVVVLVVVVLKGVLWIVRRILQFVPFIGVFVVIPLGQIVPMPYPPTPTPWGQGLAVAANTFGDSLILPDTYTVWYFAPDAISWWNRIGTSNTSVVQLMFLVMLILLGVFMTYKMTRNFNNDSRGEESAQ